MTVANTDGKEATMPKQKLFAAVWSDYPLDGQESGDCDEIVNVYPVLSDAVRACEEWADQERDLNVRIFVAEGINLNGEYGETLLVF